MRQWKRSNDDLRNNNGLRLRDEQENLEKELEDAQTRNFRLEQMVDMSSVDMVEKYKKERNKAVARAKDADNWVKYWRTYYQKDAESEIRKIQRETRKKVQDAEGRATIWGIGLAMTVAFSMFFNDALLKDAVELVTVQENLWVMAALIAGIVLLRGIGEKKNYKKDNTALFVEVVVGVIVVAVNPLNVIVRINRFLIIGLFEVGLMLQLFYRTKHES